MSGRFDTDPIAQAFKAMMAMIDELFRYDGQSGHDIYSSFVF